MKTLARLPVRAAVIPVMLAGAITFTAFAQSGRPLPGAQVYEKYEPKIPKGEPSKPGEVHEHIDTEINQRDDRELEIPEEVAAKLEGLPKERYELLESGKTSSLVSPKDMYERIERMTAAEARAYVGLILDTWELEQFTPGRDPDSIALNTESPTFNRWRLRRPTTLDPKREPGPIALGSGGGRGGRLPTFMGAPVAFTPEDLKAGKVDVAIVGAPLNQGSGWRDADHGPMGMRLRGRGGDTTTLAQPMQVLNVVDYGDVGTDQMNTVRAVQEVRAVVREIAEAGVIPFIVGGDHSLEYPNIAGLADVYGKGKIAAIHFDAHLDTGRGRTNLLSHGTPIYQLLKEGHVRPEDYIQIGLRTGGTERYEWERLVGMNYHTMAEVERRGWPAVMERVLDEARRKADYLYISFDVDVLDPTYMAGTGTPVAEGLHMREAVPLIRRLCAENNLIGFDIVELAPELDPSYLSVQNAGRILNACLTGVAMRKRGLTQPWWSSPLSTDHGQDDYYGDNP